MRNVSERSAFVRLKRFLDALRQNFDISACIKNDPVQFVHRFKDGRDREIAGFLSAMLAFGRVGMIIKNLNKLFDIMQWRPYLFVKDFKSENGYFMDFVHRFVKGDDIQLLLSGLKEIYKNAGGLKGLFLAGYSPQMPDLSPAIHKFVENFYGILGNKRFGAGFKFLIPPVGSRSAYKRLNLFLRWMVRKENGLDTGLWKEIKPSQLIIPLDTHIARISKNLGLTGRKTPDMKMAIEITENLKKLDPEDPLKYDFPLCHLGISEGCEGKYKSAVCEVCTIIGFCVAGCRIS